MAILLVDDNPLMQQVISRFLVAQGFDIVVATNAGDALIIAREQHCDLLLIDLNLPDLDGPDLLVELRRQPGYRDVPAVAVSGMGELQREEGQRAGFSDYLSKPIDLDVLVDTVQRYIGPQARVVGVVPN